MQLQQHTLKISKKGQITLPKYIREALGSERVKITLVNHHVRIEAVKSVAGSLKQYAQAKVTTPNDETEQAWDAVMKDSYESR